MMKTMNSMKTFNKLIMISMAMLLCGFFTNAMAQSSRRYAESVFDEVNIETGIPFSSAIMNVEADNEGGDIYTLQGVKVSAPQKGIYLRNGKKYLVK